MHLDIRTRSSDWTRSSDDWREHATEIMMNTQQLWQRARLMYIIIPKVMTTMKVDGGGGDGGGRGERWRWRAGALAARRRQNAANSKLKLVRGFSASPGAPKAHSLRITEISPPTALADSSSPLSWSGGAARWPISPSTEESQ